MAKLYQPITSCLKKNIEAEEAVDQDKKTDTKKAPSAEVATQPGLLWRMSSGIYNAGAGAVSLGTGGIKWAASTTYNVGAGVLTATQGVVAKVKTSKSKPKSE